MQLLADSDAVTKDKVKNDEVSFDEASPFELHFGLFLCGSWFAIVALKFFVGEIPPFVMELTAYVKGEMTSWAPWRREVLACTRQTSSCRNY